MSSRMSLTRVLFGSYMSVGLSLIRVSVSARSAFFIVSPAFNGSPSENRIPLQQKKTIIPENITFFGPGIFKKNSGITEITDVDW